MTNNTCQVLQLIPLHSKVSLNGRDPGPSKLRSLGEGGSCFHDLPELKVDCLMRSGFP